MTSGMKRCASSRYSRTGRRQCVVPPYPERDTVAGPCSPGDTFADQGVQFAEPVQVPVVVAADAVVEREVGRAYRQTRQWHHGLGAAPLV